MIIIQGQFIFIVGSKVFINPTDSLQQGPGRLDLGVAVYNGADIRRFCIQGMGLIFRFIEQGQHHLQKPHRQPGREIKDQNGKGIFDVRGIGFQKDSIVIELKRLKDMLE